MPAFARRSMTGALTGSSRAESVQPSPALARDCSIVVLTHLTSPYQVELFNAIAASRQCNLEVFYLHSSSPIRSWRPRPIEHRHVVVGRRVEAAESERLASADLVVFNYYDDARATKMIGQRDRTGKPWCFWGERPGVRIPGWIGRLYRRRRLGRLVRSHAPIWGIGQFALEQYRREFGIDRSFQNLPYYSDLSRFAHRHGLTRYNRGTTTFLCAGALIPRKGVVLLAQAFRRLAERDTNVRLRFLGDGPLSARLRELLAPVASLVTFVGFKDWGELPEEFGKADVLCTPSLHDGWGLVVPEALASGMPVIASDRTGAALELLRPRRNGWLIPAGDEPALFAAMADAAGLSEHQFRCCSVAALESVRRHRLEDGVNRFLAASAETLHDWPASRSV